MRSVNHQGGDGGTHNLGQGVGDIDDPKILATSISRILIRDSTELAMKFADIVVERLTNDLAIVTDDHGDTT